MGEVITRTQPDVGHGVGLVDLLRLRLAQLAGGDEPAEARVEAVLRELARVVATLPGVDGSAAMVVSDGCLRFVSAVSTPMLALGLSEEKFQHGPCCDSARQQAGVVVDDVGYDHVRDQWPQWVTACQDDGVRSVAAMPLVAMGSCWAVISAGSRSETPWDDHGLSTIRLLADVAASCVALASQPTGPPVRITGRDVARTPTSPFRRTPQALGRIGGPATTAEHGPPASLVVVAVHIEELGWLLQAVGPAAGAVVVAEVYRRLHGSVEAQVVRRTAEDAFLLVPAATGDGEGLLALGRRIQADLGRPAGVGEVDLSVTASIGVAAAAGSASFADLRLAASQAMHQARRGHGGAVVVTAHHDAEEPWHASQGEVSSDTVAGFATTAVATSSSR